MSKEKKLAWPPSLKEALPDVRHKVTLDQIARFEQALKELEKDVAEGVQSVPPALLDLEKRALEAQLADLRAEAATFEKGTQ